MLCKIMGWKNLPVVCLLFLAGCSWPDRDQTAENSQTTKAPAAAPASKKTDSVAAPKPEKQDILPEDVSAFIASREGCDHFRGEEAYDKERGEFIRENLEQLCTGTDAKLAALKLKYAGSADVTARLSVFESKIE